ncbi:S-layer homology domain-containing protein [Paenibacillus sp. PL2-23]|uniref:S-layer homology domain-containing protein n=1 Tax=Paenibacillus sp. PL2-23 TaxID=2100729 RepID=UPI0030FD2069
MKQGLLKRSVSMVLSFALIFSFIPPVDRAEASQNTDSAAYYEDNERFDDFQNLDSTIPMGQAVNSSNTTARTLNNWRSNASAGVWSIGTDAGSNVGMVLNGNGTSTAWLIEYSANDVLFSAKVKPDTSSATSTSYFGVATRVTDNNNMYAVAIRKVSATQHNLVLFKRVSGTITEISQSVPIPNFTANQYYRMTMQTTGTPGNTVLIGSIEGGPTVTATVTDTTGIPTGSSVGFFGSSSMKAFVDDIYAMKLFPGTPTGVTIVSAVDNQISLKWSGAAGAERYHVKRGTAPGGPFTTIATVSSGSYQDTSVTNGSTYYYAVSSAAKTMDGVYLDGSLSASAAASPLASTAAPEAPGQLFAAIRDTEVGITWTEVPNAVGYKISRSSISGESYSVVATVDGVSTSYLDQGLTVHTDYYYTVTAYNASGDSLASPELYARTEYPPLAPQGLTAIPGHSTIKLQWQPVADAVSYTLKRASSSGGSYSVLASGLTAPAYEDSNLQNGETYFYVVQALNDKNGSSLNSLEASAKPQMRYTFTETQVSASAFDSMYNGDGTWGNKPANTIDDNPNTRWGANGEGAWVQYDLGTVSTIGYAGIAFYKGNERSYAFDIQSSNDGITWNTIYTGNSSGKTLGMETFDVDNTDARYVRIVGKGNSATAYNGYTAVHVYSPVSGDTTDPIGPVNQQPAPNVGERPIMAGLYNPDGTPHELPLPNATTGTRINVKDHGAIGDGVADDRLAIQNAINAAQPGDEVYLPNGIYKLMSTYSADTHIMLKTGVNLTGESREGAILLSDFDNRLGPDDVSTGLTNASSRVLSAMNLNSITISSLTISSTWDNEYPTDPAIAHPLRGGYKHGIYIDKSTSGSSASAPYNIVVDNVIIEKFEKTGVRMAKGKHLVVRNSIFRDATDIGGGGAGYGIALQGDFKVDRYGYEEDSQFNLIENNVFDGTNAMRHGIIVQAYTHNNLVHNNTLINNTYDAIDLHGEDEYLNEVSGNTIIGTRRGAGIALGNTGGGYPSNHSEAGPFNYIHSNTLRNNAEGITVVLGSPDTIIENNIIEIDRSTFVRGPYQQSLIGLRLLNAPRTIASKNTIRNFEATDVPILLDYDNGDTNAGYIGNGNPRDIQLLDNNIEGSMRGIEIRKGHGHVVTPSGVPILNMAGNPIYNAVHYAAEDTRGQAEGPFAALFKFDLANIDLRGAASLQLSGRLTDTNPGGETITLQVYGMTSTDMSSPSAAAAEDGVYLGEFTMKGFKDNTYNLPYNVDSYNISTDAMTQYVNSRLDGEAVFLVADMTGQGVPIELYAASHPFINVRPLLKTAAYVPPVYPVTPNDNEKPADNTVLLDTNVVTSNGKTIAQAKADGKAVEDAVKRAVNGRLTLTVDPVANTAGSKVLVNSAALRKAAGDGLVRTLVVESGLGSYQLPITGALLQELGGASELAIVITHDAAAAERAKADGWKVKASVDFTVLAVDSDGASTEISSFQQYVPRTIKTADKVNENMTAVVRVEKDGNGEIRYTSIPYTISGDTVTLYSRTNSTYMVLENAASFGDVTKHWAKEEIERMAARRIVLGISDAEFKPDKAVTRAEFAALVTRTLGLSAASSGTDSAFHDVTEKDWYFAGVKAAVEAGIVLGYEDGTFQPNRTITRQEMAVMIHRAMVFAGYSSEDSQSGQAFKDADVFQGWAKESIALMASMGIVNGVGEDRFAPNETATRAQSSAILYRMLQRLTFTN